MKNKTTKKSSAGFSLIEMCLVIFGLLLVLGTAYHYSGLLQRRTALQSEALEFADHYRVADSALRTDFKTAGHNLMLPGDYVFGGEYPLFFQPNENWKQTDPLRDDGTTYTQTAILIEDLTSNLIFRKGTGKITFRLGPGEYQVGMRSISNPDQTHSVRISGNRLNIVENQGAVFQYAFDVASGTRRDVSIATEYLQGRAVCVIDYYLESAAEKTLLYRSSENCPAYPIEATATGLNRRNVSVIHNLKISGTEMINRESVALQSFVYPSFNGQEIFSPVIQVQDRGSEQVPTNKFNNVLFFGGSPAADIYYTQDSFTIKEEGATTVVRIGQPFSSVMESPIRTGDVVQIIDYGGRQSVLGVVDEFAPPTMTVTALTADSSFGGFYTLPDNYSQHLFSAGASVVKIEPPAEWLFAQKTLFRRGSGTAWQTILLGVSSAAITENALNYADERGNSSIRSYAVDLLIAQDGAETATDGAAPEQPYRAVYTPPAINRDSNN